MPCITFEKYNDGHLDAVLKIYTYYVLNTTATFHTHVLSLKEMESIVKFQNSKYRTFVIKYDEIICGYVILEPYSKREAYDNTAEVTVYLDKEYVGKGIGSHAVQYIENFAKLKNIHVLLAVICGENSKSINMFSRNGYSECAHYREVGKKFGRLLDIVAYQKII